MRMIMMNAMFMLREAAMMRMTLANMIFMIRGAATPPVPEARGPGRRIHRTRHVLPDAVRRGADGDHRPPASGPEQLPHLGVGLLQTRRPPGLRPLEFL